MHALNRDKALELAHLLTKLDLQLNKSDKIDTRIKHKFETLAERMEESFDTDNQHPDKQVGQLINGMISHFKNREPKIVKTLNKTRSLCHQLGI